MKSLYIFDLDGTLAMIDHRRHFVEGERDQQNWPAFYAACVYDVPNKKIIRIAETLQALNGEIWIFSGRSDEVRQQTENWLLHNTRLMFDWTTIMMRDAGDYTPDDVLKKKWLDEMLPEDRERLVAVFDDRDRVVNMWRENGIICLQVAKGDF